MTDIDFDLDGAENAHTPVEHPPEPIAVTGVVAVSGHVTTREEAADTASFQTIAFGATDQKVKIVGFDKRRTRLVLIVSGTGPLFIGSEAQCAAVNAGGPAAASGATLVTGTQVTLLTRAEVWATAAPAGTGTLTAIAERRDQI